MLAVVMPYVVLLRVVILSVMILSVIVLSVVMLSVVMLSVMAPQELDYIYLSSIDQVLGQVLVEILNSMF